MNNKLLLNTLTLSVFAAVSAQAVATNISQSDEQVQVLDEVTVEDAIQKEGTTVLTASRIDIQPNASGTITDTLRGQSFVQFDANSRSGLAGGEITPPQISIRGGRHYENNFMINGISNNSQLNPGGYSSGYSSGVEPSGDAQAIILDPDLVDTITIFSENVSAEYGNFVGGVIDAKLKDSRMDRWHVKVSSRFTSDDMAKQHFVNSSDSELKDATTNKNGNPQFTRYSAGVTFEGPVINDRLGAVISYSRSHSSIPTKLAYDKDEKGNILTTTRDTTRLNENFILKLNTLESEDFYVSGTLMYSPYEHTTYNANYKLGDGDYSVKGGGWNFTLNTRANLEYGQWHNDFGFSSTELSREGNDKTTYQWRNLLNKSKDDPSKVKSKYAYWGTKDTSTEGGIASLEKEQKIYTFKSLFKLNPIGKENFLNNIKVGGEFNYVQTSASQGANETLSLDADEVVNKEKRYYLKPNVQGNIVDGIIAGEQFLNRKTVSRAQNIDIDYKQFSTFIEDEILIERFTVRPGVRATYDDLTENFNIEPRIFANVDLLNDNRFNVNAGYNRYYSGALIAKGLELDNKLNRYARDLNSDGKTVGDWKPDPSNTEASRNGIDGLETPFADEYTLGASAKVLGALFKLQGVKREFKDQLQTKNAPKGSQYSKLLTNEGKSDYWGITLSAERSFDFGALGKHISSLGITRSDLKSNNTNWLDSFGENDAGFFDPDKVYLNGKKVDKTELPATNFNAPWIITYSHSASFWQDRARALLLARWESAADRLISVESPEKNVKAYEIQKGKSLFNVDLSVSVDVVKWNDAIVTLDLEALNLFDRKNLVNTSTGKDGVGTYSMGRQFFVGLKAEY